MNTLGNHNWEDVELYLRVNGELPDPSGIMNMSEEEILKDGIRVMKKAIKMIKDGRMKSPSVSNKRLMQVAKYNIKDYTRRLQLLIDSS